VPPRCDDRLGSLARFSWHAATPSCAVSARELAYCAHTRRGALLASLPRDGTRGAVLFAPDADG